MTKESQNVEYKQSWLDEYLKWLCGFANAQNEQNQVPVKEDVANV